MSDKIVIQMLDVLTDKVDRLDRRTALLLATSVGRIEKDLDKLESELKEENYETKASFITKKEERKINIGSFWVVNEIIFEYMESDSISDEDINKLIDNTEMTLSEIKQLKDELEDDTELLQKIENLEVKFIKALSDSEFDDELKESEL